LINKSDLKVAITGLNGFLGGVIGNHLSEQFDVIGCGSKPSNLNIKSKLTFITGHFQNEDVQLKLFQNTDVLIHCAATIYLHYKESEKVYRVNVTDSLDLVENAIKSGIKHIIYFSSIHAFKEDLIEIHVDSQKEQNKVLAYNYSKAISSEAIKDLCAKNKVKCTVLYPTAVLGANNERGGTMQKALDLAVKMPILTLPNTGFDIVDVDDIAEAVKNVIIESYTGDFILAGGKTWKIPVLCRTYLSLIGMRKTVFSIPIKPLLPLSKFIYFFHKATDFSPYNMYTLYHGEKYKIKNDLPRLLHKAPTPIETTLKKIVQWKQS
jgi:dihydroflavonol-4-reductase